MKNLLVILLACLVSLSAFAAVKKPVNELGITAKDCQALVAYQPAADVEYKPGLDVHGKPVVEADLNPSPVALPDVYQFTLTVDAARHIGMHIPAGLEGAAPLGVIAVGKDGSATFNGNPLEGDAIAALKAVCAAQKASETSKKPAP